MTRYNDLTSAQYADLVRKVVAWVQAQEHFVTMRTVARRFRLTLAQIEEIVNDSEVYGDQLMLHAQAPWESRGDVTMDVVPVP